MSNPFIQKVFTVAKSKQADFSWKESLKDRIDPERKAIDNALSEPDAPAVYGFNRLLGEMDDSEVVSSEDQKNLLKAHLVGHTYTISEDFMRLVSAVKAQQLSHGGTGIHPDTYSMLFDTSRYREGVGAWSASYGSGDVCAGAWWLNNVLNFNNREEMHPGDLIALISGNFISTSWSIKTLVNFIEMASEFLSRYLQFSVYDERNLVFNGVSENTAEKIKEIYRTNVEERVSVSGVQLPVSLRDSVPVIRVILKSIENLASAVESRLSYSPGNPLFVFTEDEQGDINDVNAISQGSFLGFDLTYSLTSAAQNVHLMNGILQRVIAYQSAQTKSTDDPSVAKIQNPKVASAYLQRNMLSGVSMPAHFTGQESEGVEDLWDLSLLTAQQVSNTIDSSYHVFSVVDQTVYSKEERHDSGLSAEIEKKLYQFIFGIENAGSVIHRAKSLNL